MIWSQIESKSDSLGQLDVEGSGVIGILLTEICSLGIDHLDVHTIVDSHLKQKSVCQVEDGRRISLMAHFLQFAATSTESYLELLNYGISLIFNCIVV